MQQMDWTFIGIRTIPAMSWECVCQYLGAAVQMWALQNNLDIVRGKSENIRSYVRNSQCEQAHDQQTILPQ